jgi:threonine/homoserine/homoserine lactone efflux protein
MGQAIGEILPLAVGVALSPVPIIAIILMLGTPRARSNGPAFALGWLVGLTIAGGVMLVIASGSAQEDGGGPATWVSVLKLVIGVLFLLLAARTWHGRPRAGQEAAMPRWMRAIDRFTAVRSLVFGVLLSAVNPKNLALTIAAAAAIGQTGISTGRSDRVSRRLHRDRLADDPRAGRPLLRAGREVCGHPRGREGLDGRSQRRDHDGALTRARGEVDRRRDRRLQLVMLLAR